MQQRQHSGTLRRILAIGVALLVAQPLVSGQSTQDTGEKCSGRVIPQLVDVTAKTGIHFKHTSDPEKKIIIESMTGGILLLDYDRDGWVDVYFTNAPSVAMANAGKTARGALYHNNHDGTFTDVTDKAGVATPCFAMGGSVGDYNNDGWPDMYITCHGGNVLYRNNGDGTFTDVAKQAGVSDGRWSMGSAFGDYDGDGFLDLMVSNYVDLNFQDPPKFGSAPTCKYRGVEVQCGPRGLKGAGDSLFHNNGDGTFTDVSRQAGVDDPGGYYGLTVAWSDFNNTGRPSIFVANDSTPNFLYRNEGNGKFTEIGLESGTAVNADGSEQANMGVAIGDYLHSGLPAIYSTSYENEYKVLYRNNGDWDFKDVTHEAGLAVPSLPWVGWGTGFVDLDNDGWLDIVAVNGHVYPQVDVLTTGAKYLEPKNVFLNEKNGRFCDASSQSGPSILLPQAARSIVFGDLFNDGQVDAIYSDIDGPPTVLRNQGVPGMHWVSFELAGTRSNRLAIGAKLKLVAGGMTQTDEIHSGGSYISQNDLRIHFGLAQATKIDSLEIHWPSGKVETIKDLAADKFYAVLEGSGVVDRSRIVPAPKH
ncbi:MAG TPA: CRTAC1 family protein [Acidisarcina sp.]|nr:CRTAC1 family protein [Acidisarcina sp.]